MSDNAPLSPAEQLANNITALHLNGHSGMDVSTQVALASSGEQPNVMLAIADKIKQATAQTSAGIQSFFSDAQQARIPSITQQLANTITGHSSTALYEDHVSAIQQDLIKNGFAPKTLSATGIWTPEWTAAASAARYANLTKPGVGNAPAKSTVQHILGALSLSRNANVVLQVVKALPRETLQAIGDLVSGHSMITNPLVKSDSFVGAGRAIAQLGAKPENRTSNAEFAKRAESGSQAFQDLMSVLTFLPMGQLVKGIKFAGVEAKTGKILAADVVKPKYTLLNSIVAAEKAGMPSLLTATSAKAFANKPILKQIYWGVDHAINTLSPAIAKTAPIQIAIRDAFAQRLRLPVVRAANKAGFAIMGAGLKEQAIALAESKTGGKDGVLDSTVYGVAPISGFMANALDIFSAQMNPASSLGRTGAVAGILGDTKKSTDAFRNALDDMGALRAWQRANPKLDYHAIVAEHIANGGTELDFLKEIGQQINQMAVTHAFQELKIPLLNDGSWAKMNPTEKEIWGKSANKQIWADAENPDGLLQTARTTLVLDQNAMETGFTDVGVGISQDVRKGVKARQGTSSINQKLKANVAMESLLNNDLAKYFVSPATLKTFKAMAKDIADQTALEESDFALGQGTGEVTRIKAPKIDSQFVENTHIQNILGSIGMARLDTLTNAGGIKMLNQFREELTNVGKGAAYQKLRTKIAQSLIDEFGVDVNKLADKDASDLLGEFEKQVDGLAHDLRIVRDAPPEVQALIAQMKDAGYKPVIGTDIGHVFNKAAQFTDLGAADFAGSAGLQATSKVARAIGISPRLSTSAAISARSAVELRKSVQAGIDSGKIQVLSSFNADRLITYLRNTLESQTELTIGQKAVMGASKEAGNYDIAIQKIITAAAKENKVVTKEEAWNMIKAAKRTELGLREVNYKDLMAVLTKPMDKDVAELMGLPKGSAFMDEQSARNTIHAIWKARVNVPSEMIGGIAKLEDILYSGFYVGNKWNINKNAMKLMAIPSTLMNLRSRVRYQESVVFAFRRMFKTMAKGITENIPPVLYADAKMTDMGIAEEAARIHARIYPKDAAKASFLDDAERIVKEADFYNLYNPVASEQWAAYWLAKQGFSDAEILQKTENIMGYGERTAAERSLNAIFFPFSFNKTVMRQFGKFLLTNPGQRVLVSGMINLYDQLNGPELKKWLDENAPLIKQLEAMNALEHGVGLGGFGGINAPYIQGVKGIMTVLGPKAIHYGAPSKNDPTLVTLAKYVPMVKEFNDLFLKPQDAGHLFEGQVQTTLKTVLSVKDRIGSGESFFNPKRHTLMGFQAQQTAAWDYRTQLITGLTPILDNNYKNPNNKKVWPDWIPVEVGIRGLPINKATIGQLVHYKYPAWDNAASAVISAQKATETNRFIGEVTARDKELGALYRGFDNAAKKVSDGVAKDSIAAPKLVILTDGFRQIAIQLAKQDANFAGFYKTHYERTFGPLEGLTNG